MSENISRIGRLYNLIEGFHKFLKSMAGDTARRDSHLEALELLKSPIPASDAK